MPVITLVQPPPRESHARAIELLRGTRGQFIAACVIPVGAVALIIYVLDHFRKFSNVPPHAALYIAQSCVFLTSLTFFQAKTMRDAFTASLPTAPEGAQWLKGSWEWQAGVATMAGTAAIFMLHSLISLFSLTDGIDIAFEPFVVLCLAAFFLIASSANLAKVYRDRTDADAWENAKDSTAAVFELAKGTNANTFLVFSSFSVAMLSIFIGIGFFKGLSIETRGFFAMGGCFLITSAFWVGKIIRDAAEPPDSPLQPQPKDYALSFFSMLMASTMVFGGIAGYASAGVLNYNQALYFTASYFFALFTTSWVSKWLRDRLEINTMETTPTAPAVARRLH